eukprot:8470912-Alexandrium_andersonii.AAC.1
MATFHHFAHDASRRARLASGLPAPPKNSPYVLPWASTGKGVRERRRLLAAAVGRPLAPAREPSCPRALQ